MADIRSITGQSLVPQAQPSARSEAVRAAQRAFFQAALAGESAAPAVRSAPAMTGPATTGKATSGQAAGAAPGRMLRPGSIVDIKV